MRLTDILTGSRVVRFVVLAAFVCLAGLGIWAIWADMGNIRALLAMGLSLITFALIKVVLESVSETARTAREVGNLQSGLLGNDGRVVRAEHTLSKLESIANKDKSQSEALLNRVRTVERKVGQQAILSEKILDRVRENEGRLGEQIGFNNAILDRIRSAESRLSPTATAPPGRSRRLALARELIESAVAAVAETEFGQLEESIEACDDRSSLDETQPQTQTVTIVVPCYNDEEFVGDALRSIAQQRDVSLECIVVDDGSTDRSVAEIELATRDDDRFRLLRHDSNRGVSAARNTGLREASSGFVVFHDADDLMMAHSLKDRLDALEGEQDKDVVGVYCGVRIVDEGVSLEDLPESEPWKPRLRFADFVNSEGECPFPLTAAMLRSDVVRAHGGFREDLKVGEDWDLWNRIMRSGFYFVPSDSRTVIYRQTGSSTAQTHAVSHVAVATDLIDEAYSQTAVVGGFGASYAFPLPLHHYQSLLIKARRVIQYAAMTLLRSDINATKAILDSLQSGSWSLLERHIDVDASSTDGFRRASGLDVSDMPYLEDELEPLRRVMRAAVREATL